MVILSGFGPDSFEINSVKSGQEASGTVDGVALGTPPHRGSVVQALYACGVVLQSERCCRLFSGVFHQIFLWKCMRCNKWQKVYVHSTSLVARVLLFCRVHISPVARFVVSELLKKFNSSAIVAWSFVSKLYCHSPVD